MQSWIVRTLGNVSLALMLSLSLLGCVTQLAPPYDKAVVDGLSSANTEAMTLLAEVSYGTDKATFPRRQDKYNALIGKLEALAVSAGARPMPSNNVTETILKMLEKRGALQGFQVDDSTPPSAHATKKIAGSFEKMRDQDMKAGLKPGDVQAFKGQIAIYFDQAITYENFLMR